MNGWMPIATAPQDTPVLVVAAGHEPTSAALVNACGVMAWHTNAELFECFYPVVQFDPTHWHPLPEFE